MVVSKTTRLCMFCGFFTFFETEAARVNYVRMGKRLNKFPHADAAYAEVRQLCSSSVLMVGGNALGAERSGITSEDVKVSRYQIAQKLAVRSIEADAFLSALGFPEHQVEIGIGEFCEAMVVAIPTLLHKAIPKESNKACLDSNCDESMDVSESELLKDNLVSLGIESEAEFEPPEIQSPYHGSVIYDTPELLRSALNVQFNIWPSPDEIDDEVVAPSSLSETEDPGKVAAFGSKIDKSRHNSYIRLTVKAAAWVADAIRKMDDHPEVLKKWFILKDDSEVPGSSKEARKKCTDMVSALSKVYFKKGEGHHCTSQTYAYVKGEREAGGRYVINICEHFWKVSDEERISTLVHEASHHFGTIDATGKDGKKAYGEDKCLKLDSHQAKLNADNWMFFVRDLAKKQGASWTDEASRLARVEELKKELADLVGLDQVKASVQNLLDLVAFSKVREERGLSSFSGQSLHMRFLGNPGTGKTVVARIVGELLLAMGAITPKEGNSSSFVFKEASRADLVAEYKGQTAIKVQKLVQESLGGVLFIDEAYSLVQGPKDSFGVEAVDTLIKEMEDNRAHIIVILAGYTKEMEDFFNSNPGFRSRVPFSFSFNDYSCPELIKIGQLQMRSKGMAMDGNGCDTNSTCWWLKRAAQLTTECCDEEDKSKCVVQDDRSNGNGRAMRNVLENAYRQMSLRVLKSVPADSLKTFYHALNKSGSSTSTPQCANGTPDVVIDEYSGPDLRCTFSLLNYRDIVTTSAKILDLNVAPCKMSVTEDEVVRLAADAKTWRSFGKAVTNISTARFISSDALEKACRTLKDKLENQVSSLAQLSKVSEHNFDVAPKGFTMVDIQGNCRTIKNRRLPSVTMLALRTVASCARSCTPEVRCKGFSFASDTKRCIHHSKLPRGTDRRSSYTCYVRDSAAEEEGHGTISTRPTKTIKKPLLQSLGHFDDKSQAEVAIDEVTVPGGTDEKVDKLMDKLNRLVGLAKVKAGMGELRAMVDFDQWRKKLLPEAKSLMGQSFHMQFLGNPGTGKTVVARIVGQLLVQMGVIEGASDDDEPVFEEVARADLVAEYKGQTAPKVIAAVEKATGGVLFIDEAYALKKEGKDVFGQEAVDTLIKEIEDKRDRVIAIFAGYEQEMETFFDSNPGFKSRVPFKFYFDDYTCTELNQMAVLSYGDKKFSISTSGSLWLNRTIKLVTGCCETGDCEATRDNGNGRTVRNILEASYRNFAARVVPKIHKDPELREVVDRVEEFAVLKKEKLPEYQRHYGTGKGTRERLEKDFGMQAVCSDRNTSGKGSTFASLCDRARSMLSNLTGEDIVFVTASKTVDLLLTSCRAAKRDLNELESLARSAMMELSSTEWDEIASSIGDENCDETLKLFQKASRLITLLSDNIKALEGASNVPNSVEPRSETLTLMEDSKELAPVLAKLQRLVGLNSVKEAMGTLFGLVKLSSWRSGLGMSSLSGQSFHMRFLGNPGTGKTVVARIVGEMLVKMNVVAMPTATRQHLEEEVKKNIKAEGKEIPRGEPIEIPLVFREASRVDMVASYSGQTAPKVEAAVANALGGVLFIDEAYALVRDGKDNFGQEAVDTLIKQMEDKRKNIIVILAGYEAEMDTFFDSNPGFKSRVPFTFRFEDYSCNDLSAIGKMVLKSQGLRIPDNVIPRLSNLIEFSSGCCETVGATDCHPSRDNGNGRTVRNIAEALSRAMASRVIKAIGNAATANITEVELESLTAFDVETVAEEQAAIRLQNACGQEGLVKSLSKAATKTNGLRKWFRKYKLSKPEKQLHTVVRETGRMTKSLTSFESRFLKNLEAQCTSVLQDLVSDLGKKIAKTCAGGDLSRFARDIAPEKQLTVPDFRLLVSGVEAATIEAKLLQRLLTGEDLPAPLTELDEQVATCDENLAELRSKSLLAPLEAAVSQLTDK